MTDRDKIERCKGWCSTFQMAEEERRSQFMNSENRRRCLSLLLLDHSHLWTALPIRCIKMSWFIRKSSIIRPTLPQRVVQSDMLSNQWTWKLDCQLLAHLRWLCLTYGPVQLPYTTIHPYMSLRYSLSHYLFAYSLGLLLELGVRLTRSQLPKPHWT